MGHRTSVQIERPHIIEGRFADLTSKDEELGTSQRHGMVGTTAGSWSIDRDAGPLMRYWSTRSSDQLESISTSKDMTCQG
jgi:hypothetical protein